MKHWLEFGFGRAYNDNDAPLVSRLHCQLSATGQALEVKDLESTNGTFVNDKRIATARLQDGDRLKVGRVELRVKKGQD